MTSYGAPEIAIVHGTYSHPGVPDLLFFRPRCLRCGWEGENVRTEGLAKVDAALHIRLKCLAEAAS